MNIRGFEVREKFNVGQVGVLFCAHPVSDAGVLLPYAVFFYDDACEHHWGGFYSDNIKSAFRVFKQRCLRLIRDSERVGMNAELIGALKGMIDKWEVNDYE